MKHARCLVFGSLAVGLTAALAAPANCQTRRAVSAADLASVETSYAYAQAAAQAGDLKGAIVGLERVLTLNPNLPNIQLELGLLYLQAGSTELASYHLQAALAAPSITAAARTRAQQALAQASGAGARHVLTGVASIGARYESNANAGPGGRNVLLFGLPAILDDTGIAGNDMSFTGALTATYAYRFAGQRGNLFEVDTDLFASRYDRRTDLNFAAAALQAGPRFFAAQGRVGTFSVRPFVAGSYQTLGDDEYLKTYGGGLNIQRSSGARLFMAATFLYAREDYRDSAIRIVHERSGDAFTGVVDLTYAVAPRWQLRVGAIGRRDNTDAPFQAYDRFGGSIGAVHVFSSTKPAGAPSLAAQVGYTRANYDAPDPSIDPASTRRDNRWDASLTFAAPITRQVSLVLTAQHIDNGSNVALYDFTNTVARVEAQFRF